MKAMRSENEKLAKKAQELEQKLAKLTEELEIYKKENDANNQAKKKFVMRPKRKLQPPTNIETEKKVPSLNLEKLKESQSDSSPEKSQSIGKPQEGLRQSRQTSPKLNIKPNNVGSDKSSIKENGTPVIIQPKTNNPNTLKGPLKNYTKKQESLKNEKVSYSLINIYSEYRT